MTTAMMSLQNVGLRRSRRGFVQGAMRLEGAYFSPLSQALLSICALLLALASASHLPPAHSPSSRVLPASHPLPHSALSPAFRGHLTDLLSQVLHGIVELQETSTQLSLTDKEGAVSHFDD